MLLVVLDWIYMTIIMLVLGNAVLCGLSNWFIKKNKIVSVFYSIVCGYVTCTVYSMLISTFMRVNIEANVILIILTILAGILSRKSLYRLFSSIVDLPIKDKILYSVIIIFVFGFMLTISGTPIILYLSGDTGFYHSQEVHWIESYGTVPGLANLNLRFGSNNSNFCLAALFGMYDLFGVSLRGTCTYLYGIFFVNTLFGFFHLKKQRYYIGEAIGIMALIYFLYRTAFSDGYNPDVLVTFFVFIIIISYCELVNREEKEVFYYGLLCLVIVFATTVKLNAAPLGISIMLMIVVLAKNRKYSDISKYCLLGLVIVAPWVVRSIIVTGYIIYPITSIDLFNFDWKVPSYSAEYLKSTFNQSAKAHYYIGNVTYEEAANTPLKQWIPGMIRYLFNSYSFEKITGVLLILSAICIVVNFFIEVMIFKKKKILAREWIPLKVSLVVAYVFCILSGPDVRFLSYTVFTIPAIFVFQYLDTENEHIRAFLGKKTMIAMSAFGCVVVILLLKGEIATNIRYLQWHDYSKFIINPGYVYTDAKPEQYTTRLPVGGVYIDDDYDYLLLDGLLRIYYQTLPSNNDFAFYDPFPAVGSYELLFDQYGERVHCRGKEYADGFYAEDVHFE